MRRPTAAPLHALASTVKHNMLNHHKPAAAAAAGAATAGPTKSQLAQLCEVLVLLREQQEVEAQELLYADSLRLLSGGDEQVRPRARP
jgi:hypothetical protein